MIRLAPISQDVEAAVALARRAAEAYGYDEHHEGHLERLEAALRSGEAPGALLLDGDRSVGLALWDEGSPLGVSVEAIYLVPERQTLDAYEESLDAIEREHGESAFVEGRWDGVDPAGTERAMRARGRRPFARSEMRLSVDHPPAAATPPEGVRLRIATDADRTALVDLHARAYRGRLDRYLFYRDPDDRKDAERLLADLYGGRWGPPIVDASVVAEEAGSVVGACLAVRPPYGALIADVMVDPAAQGRGIGRAVLEASVTALERAGEKNIVLTVTEGNSSAAGLYERVGFVRTVGPSGGWYTPSKAPVVEDG